MKQADLKEKSSVFVIGKGIIIIVLISISSLSFLLGFFVGKINRPPEGTQPPDVITRERMTGNIPASPGTGTLPEQAEIPQPSGEVRTPQDNTQANAAKPLINVSDTQKTQHPVSGAVSNETQVKPIQETNKPDDTRESIKTKKYTIQVGAFKNESDAAALKAKLDKKGYKTYLMALKPKPNENLYKVTVGAFSTRQEAELLAMKIKNSEGLKTFVTLRIE
jgi:DedD protein